MKNEGTTAVAPIGVVVAMEAELQHLLARVTLVREVHAGPWRDRFVQAGDVPLIALCSGIGMVNAAAGTEHLIGEYAPRAILNFGCAGAHRRDILPGDVVVGDGTVHHGAVHFLASGEEFFPGADYQVTGAAVASTELATDPGLRGLAVEAAEGWTPEPWPLGLNLPAEMASRPPQVHVGRVASADIWTQFHERIDSLHARHGSLCEDMEAAAIAQVCGRHGVSFLTVKDISNNEFHALTELQGDIEVLPAAEIGRRAAALLLRTIAWIGDALIVAIVDQLIAYAKGVIAESPEHPASLSIALHGIVGHERSRTAPSVEAGRCPVYGEYSP